MGEFLDEAKKSCIVERFEARYEEALVFFPPVWGES